MENKEQFKDTLEVIQYLTGVCGYYKPLEEAFNKLLENIQYADISSLKDKMDKLTKENLELKDKTQHLSKLDSDNKGIIESLGKQLALEKLSRIKNEEVISALGKQLAETKINSIKEGN